MPAALDSVIWGIVTLSIVVVIHELGHFGAAKLFGLRVHEFMVGLPGPSLSVRIGETKVGITALPFGGYVKIAGMAYEEYPAWTEAILSSLTAVGPMSREDIAAHFPSVTEDGIETALLVLEDWGAVSFDERHGRYRSEIAPESLEVDPNEPGSVMSLATGRTYLALSAWKRVVVLGAGVLVNLVTAIGVLTIVLSLWGAPTDVGLVDPVGEGPAATAGVRPGDRLVSIDGRQINDFTDVVTAIDAQRPGDAVQLVVEHDPTAPAAGSVATALVDRGGQPTDVGDRTTITVNLIASDESTAGAYLGVSPHLATVRLEVGQAVRMSVGYLGATVRGIGGLLNPETAAETVQGSSSVVGISVVAAQAASSGPVDYAFLIAAISLSLGVFNLIPFPPLDGGRIAIVLVEATIRRRVPSIVTGALSMVGMLALFALMAVLMFNDISRLVG